MADSLKNSSMTKLFIRTNPQTAKKTLLLFWNEMSKDKKSVWIYSICIPINRLLYIVLLPLLFSLVIQSLITNPHNWQYPILLLGIGVIVSIISLVVGDIGFRRLFRHEERMRTSLTVFAMDTLLAHSDQYFANKKVGSLSGDVDKFGDSILSFLDVIFLQASGIIVNFIASLIIIAFLSPILLLPLTIVTVYLVWKSAKGAARRGPLRHQRKLLQSKLNGTVADIIGNQQIVRYFATTDSEISRVISARSKIESIANSEIDIMQRESILRQAVLFGFQIATLAACVWLYTHDMVSIAALVFAVTYLGRLTGSLFEISPLIRNTEQAFLNASGITDILDETPEVKDTHTARPLRVTDGSVGFSTVDFRYKDSSGGNVIQGLSLSIAGGERIGLAGLSGGGKTTLTKLLLRFADSNKGTITIDGQDITKVSQHSLRENIAYVPQEPYLFHRSLRENIAYGRQDATDQEIYTAIDQANARDFVDTLPDGLNTVVGERGVKLSGGQRQRIAIARAILKDAPILILDEATSALDSESEKLIQDALETLMSNKTSIVVAHRLSTIARLDRIIVLENGKIIEDGSHGKLLKEQGVYAKLWSHQSGGFIEE
ncbi:MAG: putative ABC transporter ATP-binding protein [Candidatus Saccharibacteria bacterium GW2011_GWC2_44_17]|nr:MAG: putative ABC transporter ATP-binding protein [Candidatus Saccharibacteria bacterium GW2011_GWC2_44_17]